MKGPVEVTAIAEVLFDFMGQGIPIDTEDTIMGSVCDLIDFDGDVDMPMEDIEVSPEVAPSDASPQVSFTRRRTFEDAFSPSDDCFVSSKKLKAEPVPMEVDRQPLFLPSYLNPQYTLTDIYGSCHNYEDAFSPDDQVRRDLVVSLRNFGLDVPVELAGPTRPVKKVIRKATRVRAGGLHKYSRPAVVQGEIGSKSPREHLILFAHFNPNGFLVN